MAAVLYLALVLCVAAVTAERVVVGPQCTECQPEDHLLVGESGRINFNPLRVSVLHSDCSCVWKLETGGLSTIGFRYSLGDCIRGDGFDITCKSKEGQSHSIVDTTAVCGGSADYVAKAIETDHVTECTVRYTRVSLGTRLNSDNFLVEWESTPNVVGTDPPVGDNRGGSSNTGDGSGAGLSTIGSFFVPLLSAFCVVMVGGVAYLVYEKRKVTRGKVEEEIRPGAAIVHHGGVRPQEPRHQNVVTSSLSRLASGMFAAPVSNQSMANMGVHLQEIPEAPVATNTTGISRNIQDL